MLVPRSSKIEVDQAANIAGWMGYEELMWLAKQAQKHSTIVEVGSYQGRSTRAVGDNTEGVVYAVDDFKGPRDVALPVLYSQHLFEAFVYNLADLIQIGRVVPVAADHANLPELPRPDMVFIDGSHTYEDVKRDIAYWLPRLLPGGLICGHDIQFPQVRQAVSELLKKYKVGRNTTIWYV